MWQITRLFMKTTKTKIIRYLKNPRLIGTLIAVFWFAIGTYAFTGPPVGCTPDSCPNGPLANLLAENIKDGVTIVGVTGTLNEGYSNVYVSNIKPNYVTTGPCSCSSSCGGGYTVLKSSAYCNAYNPWYWKDASYEALEAFINYPTVWAHSSASADGSSYPWSQCACRCLALCVQ